MDPLAVLGVTPDASPDQLAAAYRALAKQWHPDRAEGSEEALRRMAEINVAYDRVRGGVGASTAPRPHDADASRGVWGDEARATAEAMSAAEHARRAGRTRRLAGWWLPESVRGALGAELLRALQDEELVLFVRQASTWQSPATVLAVTDRRLLWLADDAVADRVHALRYGDVTAVALRPPRGLRRTAVLRVTNLLDRRFDFAGLSVEVGTELADEVTRRAPRVR